MPTITNQAYMIARPIHKTYTTDTYYVPLANKILKMLLANYKGKKILDTEALAQIARKTTWYFEDVVSDLGIWRSFSEQCKKLYGYNVPIFHNDKEYYADEPSLDAVRYIVWDVVSELNNDMSIYPETGKLTEISNEIFNIFNHVFEKAPVNDEEKEDIKGLIEHSQKGFDELRDSLAWILMGNYITRNFSYYKDEVEAIKSLPGNAFDRLNASMKSYYVRTNNYFRYKTGPLALLPYQWLADLARVNGMEKEQKVLEDIEVLDPNTYQYKAKDDTWLHMESIDGKEFDIRAKELNLPDDALKANDGCVGQFISFNGEWHLNGILSSNKFGDKFAKLKERAMKKPNEKLLDTDTILKATGGRHLLYYKDTTEMMEDLKNKNIINKEQTFPFEDDQQCTNPCFFVNEEDPDNNIFFGFNFESYIKDPENPYYDEKEAKEDAVTILWENAAPPEFVDWLIDHDLLSDAAESQIFVQGSSKEDIKSDMHFMVRYSRRNKM